MCTFTERHCSAIIEGILRMLSALLRQLVDARSNAQCTHKCETTEKKEENKQTHTAIISLTIKWY